MNLKDLAQSAVRDIIETDFPQIDCSETVSKLISLFQASGSYEAIVTKGEKVGIVTVRDLLNVNHPDKVSVSRIQSRPPLITPDTPLYDAAQKMISSRVRMLPVVEKNKVCGAVRQTKILEKMMGSEGLTEVLAEDFMVGKVHGVSNDFAVGTVRSIMLEKGISHAPVVDEKTVIGIVTARDIVWRYLKPKESQTLGDVKGENIKILAMGINGLIDRRPLTVTRKTPVSDVIRDMVLKKSGYALVVENGKVEGIITPRDIIRVLEDFKPSMQIPIYFVGFREENSMAIQMAMKKVAAVAKKAVRINPDMLEIVVHGKTSSKTGERHRYNVTARFYSPKEVLMASSEGWSFLEVVDEICEKLERQFKGKQFQVHRDKELRP